MAFPNLTSMIFNEPAAFTAYQKVLPDSFPKMYMVGVLGVEPRTSSLSGTRSNQLSYTPGFSTPCLRRISRCVGGA